MRNKKMIFFNIGIVIILVMTAISGSSSFITNELLFKPTSIPITHQAIEVEKLVYDGNNWVDSINANIGDVLLFNISIRYNPTPVCGKRLENINVTDTLPSCLTYNPNSAEIYNWDGNIYYPTDETSGKKIFWNLTKDFAIRYFAFPAGQNFTYILFEATVTGGTDEYGEENEVFVDAYETCCSEERYAYDTATIIVFVCHDIELHKYVKNLGQWAGYTEVNTGDTVEFKITVENKGNTDLHQVTIEDDLPSYLTYNYDANPSHTSATDQHIQWNLGTLTPAQIIEITFTATATTAGTGQCNYAIVNTQEQVFDEDIACVDVVEEQEELICEKYVYDSDTQDWADITTVNVGDTVTFKITFTYYGTIDLLNIVVKDTLPNCLTYANNANPTQSGIDGQKIYWNFSSMSNGQTKTIEFDATATCQGTYTNTVIISGSIGCQIPISCEADATVIIEEEPCQGLICEKYVYDSDTQDWADITTVNVGDTVTFKITFTYYGTIDLLNIVVKDTLPNCLTYANNANPTQSGIDGQKIYWNFSSMSNGQTKTIEFDATATCQGTYTNTVIISGSIGCQIPISCEADATVIIEGGCGGLICDKYVWDPESHSWEDEISAEIGDTVRFKITISYWGDLSFYNIWVDDTLPTCLEYGNNAIPSEPEINGKQLLWHFLISLDTGDSLSIEFDTIVISGGTNVNIAKITGIECGVRQLSCQDEATVIVVNEPDELVADANGPYSGEPDELISFSGSANGGVSPYTYEWDFDYNGGTFSVDATGKNPSNSWSNEGVYSIGLRVTDNIGTKDIDTTTVTVEIPNDPPNKPDTPEGPSDGKPEKDYTFSTSSIDPEDDQIWYKWSWGDGEESAWIGPYSSGDLCEATHQWTERGTYLIRVKAKDNNNKESTWSSALEIGIKQKTRSKDYFNNFIGKLLEKFPRLEKIILLISDILTSLKNIKQ